MANILKKLGRGDEASGYLAHAREVAAAEGEYNRACLEAVSGNIEAALTLLEEALAKQPSDRGWARHDPALESLRDSPRFKALMGE